MSNFLLKDPYCVLIHIPKTGGSSIRHGIWKSNYEGPAFGEIPSGWRNYFKFAFVRHPLDRLISAWSDFSQLRNYKGDIDDFVAIVVDESILYDERRKTMAERIRHHTIPQTHPFNCLHEADFVGRYENYHEDLSSVLSRVGKSVQSFPELRKTDHGHYSDYLKGDTLHAIMDFYHEDFHRLGYARP